MCPLSARPLRTAVHHCPSPHASTPQTDRTTLPAPPVDFKSLIPSKFVHPHVIMIPPLAPPSVRSAEPSTAPPPHPSASSSRLSLSPPPCLSHPCSHVTSTCPRRGGRVCDATQLHPTSLQLLTTPHACRKSRLCALISQPPKATARLRPHLPIPPLLRPQNHHGVISVCGVWAVTVQHASQSSTPGAAGARQAPAARHRSMGISGGRAQLAACAWARPLSRTVRRGACAAAAPRRRSRRPSPWLAPIPRHSPASKPRNRSLNRLCTASVQSPDRRQPRQRPCSLLPPSNGARSHGRHVGVQPRPAS